MPSSPCELLPPPGTDLDAFRSLPREVQHEIIEEHRRQVGTHRQHRQQQERRQKRSLVVDNPSLRMEYEKLSSSASSSQTDGVDPEFLAALPEDLRRQVLQQERIPTTKTEADSRQKVSSPISRKDIPIATPIHDDNCLKYEEVCSNGTTYFGEHDSHGERHGKGILRWPNGDRYEGQFRNGMREGEGSLFSERGSEYVGEWRQDRMHGYGTRHFASGNTYHGEYVNGLRQGNGKTIFSGGDIYEGEYYKDKMNGQGTYLHSEFGECYKGAFRDGKKHGVGKYQLKDGSIDVIRYENDKRVGEGVRYSKDRKKAWRLKMDGQKKGARVSLEEAYAISQRCEEEAAKKHTMKTKELTLI